MVGVTLGQKKEIYGLKKLGSFLTGRRNDTKTTPKTAKGVMIQRPHLKQLTASKCHLEKEIKVNGGRPLP